ncbi:hypothetical protein MKW94_025349 [Papaver nudicaule]|uniref:F-box domain-containing protein n=1 Tax=Papaver nudicaule TaxID=74823 RepID=A0AA41SHU2_PAPNU|nr:hypothetical protein [Papaver nudicaule]
MMLSPNPMKRLKTNNTGNENPKGDSTSSKILGLWESLNPEILSDIFIRVHEQDGLARAVPFVCKPWREVFDSPYCWSDIDLEQWCRRVKNTGTIDFAVKKLVRRSKGNFHRLSVYMLSDLGFAFVATCAEHLKVLQIPMSRVTDKMVEYHATSFSKLTFLDISNCLQVTCKGLEILGKNCKFLTTLRRNMALRELEEAERPPAAKVNDGEALVIADTMESLCNLELCYGRFGDTGLDALLTKCKNLTHLDILGSLCVRLDGDLLDRCECLTKFRGPYDDLEDLYSDDDNEATVLSSDSDSDQ